jgi:hypothetical protein
MMARHLEVFSVNVKWFRGENEEQVVSGKTGQITRCRGRRAQKCRKDGARFLSLATKFWIFLWIDVGARCMAVAWERGPYCIKRCISTCSLEVSGR